MLTKNYLIKSYFSILKSKILGVTEKCDAGEKKPSKLA